MTMLPADWKPSRAAAYRADRVERGDRLQGNVSVQCQVCVIGTGAGGAVAAAELARAGLDVVMLEEGAYLTGEDYGRLSPIESIKATYRDAGMTFTMGSPGILMPYGRCVGGSTVINSGSAFAMSEETFAYWKRTHGLPGLEWPDVARHFQRVGRTVRIGAVPEELMGGNGRLLREGAEALGLAGEVVTRNAHGCLGRGRCYLGCPENAKQGTNLNYVPMALEAGARLYTHCRAERVLSEGGRAAGVQARATGGGARLAVRAGAVVVACGAVFTPILLSESGLLKGNRHAGKHLRIHPASRVIGLFDREIKGHIGVPQSYHVTGLMPRDLVPEGIFVPPFLLAPAVPGMGRGHLELMKQYPRMGLIGYRVIDSGEGRVAGTVMGMANVKYDLSPQDTRKLVEAMQASGEILFAAGAKRVWLPVFGRGEAGSVDELRRLLSRPVAAVDIELAAYHPHGTLRMGIDEKDSATRPDGSLFGVEGVYVADASLFPESPIVNPQLTVMALAGVVAERLAEKRGLTLAA
ncbi:MAG: GMC family oxidoreductase [Candidatus Wallbacteria bacterium]|nr:GMC family oxidoreductase [Candidatus Wallbacteria bacterium]